MVKIVKKIVKKIEMTKIFHEGDKMEKITFVTMLWYLKHIWTNKVLYVTPLTSLNAKDYAIVTIGSTFYISVNICCTYDFLLVQSIQFVSS